MRNSILTFLFLTVSVFTAFAGKKYDGLEILTKDKETGDYHYEEVVSLDGISKEEIFNRAKTWIIANMKTEDNNITFDEEDFSAVNTGAIKIDPKGFFTYYIEVGAFDFKFHVWSKEGRYKIRLDNIMYYLMMKDGNGVSSRSQFTYAEIKDNKSGRYLKEEANVKLNAFLTVFKQYIAKPEEQKKADDNW